MIVEFGPFGFSPKLTQGAIKIGSASRLDVLVLVIVPQAAKEASRWPVFSVLLVHLGRVLVFLLVFKGLCQPILLEGA